VGFRKEAEPGANRSSRACVIAAAPFIRGATAVYACNIRYVGCSPGQATKALLNTGPYGVAIWSDGIVAATGFPVRSSGAGGVCPRQSCSWYYQSEKLSGVEWINVECHSESDCAITSTWCGDPHNPIDLLVMSGKAASTTTPAGK
jgi:hypothetical protein